MHVQDAEWRIIVDPSTDVERMYGLIELIGRTCYQSEVKDIPDHGAKFVRSIVKRGHLGLLEHVLMTVEFVVDRGVTHEIVRHRHASFAQESTRYCNYANGKFEHSITVINIDTALDTDPMTKELSPDEKMALWLEWRDACRDAEKHYFRMLELGASPQIARGVLPTSVKSGLKMTANLREWRHFFALRALEMTGPVHPQVLEVAFPLYEACMRNMPEVFRGIGPKDVD